MNILRRTGEILLFILFTISCVNDVSNYNDINEDGNYVLTFGTSQRVSNSMILEVTGISDTRCPVGNVCSTPGYVEVSFEVYCNQTFSDLDIDYNTIHKTNSDTIAGHTIEITDVTPYPYADDPSIDTLDYRISIHVETD